MLENENQVQKVENNALDLDYIQQYLDGTVKISFDEPRLRTPFMLKDTESSHRKSTSSIKYEPSLKHESFKSKDFKNSDLKEFKNLKDLKLKGIKIESQVSTPCYTTNSEQFEEENTDGNVSPTQTDMEDHVPHHQLLTLNKPFKLNMKTLEKEFMSKRNANKREKYSTSHTREQKVEILNKWKEFMNKNKIHVNFFEYVEKIYKSNLNTIKEKWEKEDRTIIETSHPPTKAIIIQHKVAEVTASPFKISTEPEIKKLTKQNNYTNQSLITIGKQLNRIETKLNPKTATQSQTIKYEQPLLKFFQPKKSITNQKITQL
jgi:hypothetical protein